MFNPFARKSNKGSRGEPLPEPNNDLPDSNRPSGLCPRCGKQSSFAIAGSIPVTFDGGYVRNHDGSSERTLTDQASSLVCRHCGQAVVVIEEQWIGDHRAAEGIGQGGTVSWRGINWWPLPESELPSDVPEVIRGVFAEAAKCMYAGCPRASAVMARRALEAITVDKGEASGTLATRLAALASRNVLQPDLAEWAKEVRLVGNAGAHFDPVSDVSKDDATQLLRFVRELLKYL